ncbi:MAG TPA: hypothetical protein VGH90_05910 [Chthoniobacteraceae bacterium]
MTSTHTMNESQHFGTKTRSGYAAGIIAGLGGGFILSTVLYRHFAVSDLIDPLRLIGFALLFAGGYFARRTLKPGTTPETVLRVLGPPSNSWDDGVERCLEYSSSFGTLRIMFAHYGFFFSRPRLKLTSVEFDVAQRDQPTETDTANER